MPGFSAPWAYYLVFRLQRRLLTGVLFTGVLMTIGIVQDAGERLRNARPAAAEEFAALPVTGSVGISRSPAGSTGTFRDNGLPSEAGLVQRQAPPEPFCASPAYPELPF